MKLSKLGLPIVAPILAVGTAASLLSFTGESEAFSLLGTSLSTAQRDFRVFDNFTDSNANNNTVADPNYPGYTGVEMAVWKASIEWGSSLHGDGTGDPLQPFGLGSGGANFDVTFQGNANSVGGPNDNTHSELSGNNPPVLAFTEGPASNGWRIRYYSYVTWVDGPNSNFSNFFTDIQGVACHEYGHALGLGHSGDQFATMYGAAFGNATSGRSISSDDIAGVKWIYGIAAANKPQVSSYLLLSNGDLIINGQNFSATGNQVWFTQAGSGGNGEPVKAFNVASTSGGTQLTLSVPGNAGPGDILVKANFSGNSSLSNAWPFDPANVAPCPIPTVYCTSNPNSTGQTALIGSSGSQSVLANDFSLWSANLPAGQPGIFYYGSGQSSFASGNGVQCVASMNAYRLFPFVVSDDFGFAFYSLNLANPPSFNGQILPGSTWNFQYWYRDPAGGGAGYNFSEAIEAEFCN